MLSRCQVFAFGSDAITLIFYSYDFGTLQAHGGALRSKIGALQSNIKAH